MTALDALAVASAALALLPAALAAGNWKHFRALHDPAPPGTRVSILIPARDEEVNIERAVGAALASTGVEVEVVVLDDDSSDHTAAIVRRLAAADPRVRLVAAPPLPAGWAGKQRACQLLADAARFELLMFVDADVQPVPSAASEAAGRLLADPRLGLVSGFPRQLTGTLAERLVIPWIHVLLLGYLPMARMRTSTAPAYGAACGQWIVARRDAYVECGGHGATPASLHDGLSLTRTLRAGGWITDVFDATALASCRMYDGWAGVWRGFGKSAGEGMATPRALPVWVLLIGIGHVLPWCLLPLGLIAGDAFVATAAAVGVVANLGLRLALRRRLRQDWAGVWLHPLGAALTLLINATALVRHLRGRPSVWRGRQYVRAPGPGAAAAPGPAADAIGQNAIRPRSSAATRGDDR